MSDKQQLAWPGWDTVRLIGRGSFGAVYEIQKTIFSNTEKAALKIISIPQNTNEIDEMYGEGYDDESITSTFQSHLKNIVAEYSLMRKMNGSSNIVNCEDVRYVQHTDGIGWDIFIKMELLTPLTKALPDKIPDDTVIKVSKDMCTALELCRKYNIVHRDIKPQNIFLSPNGDYKLGDFGIAKVVEKTMGGTKIGTYKYMAPEVYHNHPYSSVADIYSLGLVLYWMLNERRMPFLPLPPEKLKAGMDEDARLRRLSGELIPPPVHGSEALKRIVLKACSYDAGDRYSSATEMLNDIKMLTEHSAIPKPIPPTPEPPKPEPPKPEPPKPTPPQPNPPTPPKPTNKAIPILILACIVVLMLLILLPQIQQTGTISHKKGWQDLHGEKYYFDDDGVMLTGMQTIDGSRYYFDVNSGKLLTGLQKIASDYYYFDVNGQMLSGWQSVNGEQYYFDADGSAVEGWLELDGCTYYFNNSGAMAKAWNTIDGITYYFDNAGQKLTGWQTLNGGKTYYFSTDEGAMLTGWNDIDGARYYFDVDGSRVEDTSVLIDEDTYYFDENGQLTHIMYGKFNSSRSGDILGVTIKLGRSASPYVMVTDRLIDKCTSFDYTLILDGSMPEGVESEWAIYALINGTWGKAHIFKLSGSTVTTTVTFPEPTYVQAYAVTCREAKYLSYTHSGYITNIMTEY